MCGRTGLSLTDKQLRCACAYKPKDSQTYIKPDWLDEYNDGRQYSPSYNIAPTDVTPVLVSSSKYKNAAHTDRILKPMMWGIVPPWHKDDYRTHGLSTNNCRVENIKNSKLYSPILSNGGRCIIVVEGFYEWQTTIKTKNKQPYYMYVPQNDKIQIDEPITWNNEYNDNDGWSGIKLLYIAGLYNLWQNNDTIIYSYSVITMESNGMLDWLHHRMPAILSSQDQIEAWLDIDSVNPDMAIAYLKPAKILSWHPVSTLVNNARNKTSECNKKIRLQEKNRSTQTTLTAWFSTTEKRKSSDDNLPASKKNKQ